MLKTIRTFASLGFYLQRIEEDKEFDAVLEQSLQANGFFTRLSVLRALSAWASCLTEEALQRWLKPYGPFFGAANAPAGPAARRRKLLIVMAGNIPLVGFHDYLCGWAAGYDMHIKLSSKDAVLLPFLNKKVLTFAAQCGEGFNNPATAASFGMPANTPPDGFFPRVVFGEPAPEDTFDAVIATGSDNTFQYFHHRYGRFPHLLRRNRGSVAVLDGSETEAELHALAQDVMLYYGLGCRNVSLLYVPQNYNFEKLLEILRKEGAALLQNPAYADNYRYQKAFAAVNGTAHFDTGSMILTEASPISSPLAVLHYQSYPACSASNGAENVLSRTLSKKVEKTSAARPITNEAENSLPRTLSERREQIQCIVGHGYLPFGTAQSPALWDYADGVDTLGFLLSLS